MHCSCSFSEPAFAQRVLALRQDATPAPQGVLGHRCIAKLTTEPNLLRSSWGRTVGLTNEQYAIHRSLSCLKMFFMMFSSGYVSLMTSFNLSMSEAKLWTRAPLC